MVEDGVAILKVGPALTFAYRKALFALEAVELELHPQAPSKLRQTLEEAMLARPEHWTAHLSGDEAELRFARAFGLSDRARYYLPEPAVEQATELLFSNLQSIPLSLVSQFFPLQFNAVREGILAPTAKALTLAHIGHRIDDYLYATGYLSKPD